MAVGVLSSTTTTFFRLSVYGEKATKGFLIPK